MTKKMNEGSGVATSGEDFAWEFEKPTRVKFGKPYYVWADSPSPLATDLRRLVIGKGMTKRRAIRDAKRQIAEYDTEDFAAKEQA